MLARVDDDELPKNEPIRIRQEIDHPRRKPKTRSRKERGLKLAKVRGEQHKGKEKNAELLRSIQQIFSKIVLTLNSTRPLARLSYRQTGPEGIDKTWALIPLVTPQNRHLAYRSDHATTRTVSLWKRPPGIMCTSKHTHYAGGIKVARVTQVHDGTHKRIYIQLQRLHESRMQIYIQRSKSYIKQIASEYGQEFKWA
jgi:hypothetical protein